MLKYFQICCWSLSFLTKKEMLCLIALCKILLWANTNNNSEVPKVLSRFEYQVGLTNWNKTLIIDQKYGPSFLFSYIFTKIINKADKTWARISKKGHTLENSKLSKLYCSQKNIIFRQYVSDYWIYNIIDHPACTYKCKIYHQLWSSRWKVAKKRGDILTDFTSKKGKG